MISNLRSNPSLTPREQRVLSIAYAFGGGIALVYQISWYHGFVNQFGATGTTFLVVLCTFIGGLAAGSLSSNAVYSWINSRIGGHGLKNYGRTELAIGLSAVVLFGITTLNLSPVLGSFPYKIVTDGKLQFLVPSILYGSLRIAVAVLAVGIPCFLMGLTFPYLCTLNRDDPAFPSRLYAANTLGACAAVLCVEFFGLEWLGYLGCLSLAAVANLIIGLYFLYSPEIPQREQTPPPASSSSLSLFREFSAAFCVEECSLSHSSLRSSRWA